MTMRPARSSSTISWVVEMGMWIPRCRPADAEIRYFKGFAGARRVPRVRCGRGAHPYHDAVAEPLHIDNELCQRIPTKSCSFTSTGRRRAR
jgi:hypothetical protein